MIIKDVLSQLGNAAGPVVKVLHRTDQVKVIVLGFKRGMTLKEHKTAIAAKLIVIDGSVTYRESDRSVALNKFEDLDITINVPHSVEALEDSLCFLIQG